MRLRNFPAFAVTICAATAMHAQNQIPFKTGLWESALTSSISGIQISPEMQARIAQMPPEAQARIHAGMGGGAPKTTVVHSCLTKEQFDKWNDAFSKSKDGQQDCVHSNVIQSASERSFDVTCTSTNGKSTGHVDMVFDSDEKGHGTVHMVRTATQGSQAGRPITMDMKIDTHYIGADCGSIKPGEAEPVK